MTRQAVSLRFGIRTALALCGTMAVAACAAKYTQVPARVNLEPYRQVALVTFSAERADTGMSVLATEQFAEALLASQGVELLEIGTRDSALSALEAKGVPAVFVGHLKLSDVKPRGHVGAAGMHLRGAVSAELSVRLVSTRSGGTIWRSSAAADGTVGRVSVSRGLPSVAMRDRERAYGELVRTLVSGVTRDLRPTLVRQ